VRTLFQVSAAQPQALQGFIGMVSGRGSCIRT